MLHIETFIFFNSKTNLNVVVTIQNNSEYRQDINNRQVLRYRQDININILDKQL